MRTKVPCAETSAAGRLVSILVRGQAPPYPSDTLELELELRLEDTHHIPTLSWLSSDPDPLSTASPGAGPRSGNGPTGAETSPQSCAGREDEPH